MQNLEIIEGNYNAHVNAFDRACSDNNDYRNVYETAYLNAVEYVLGQLGVEYKINSAGYITIEQEAE